ncbi:hypothetical protein HBI28_245990 [Parastagonospora nodorum]|nr:hypothetical protein HBI28_245990 [Parastagonospora nodorum]
MLTLSKIALLDIGREVKTLILGSSALITPIKDDDNLLNTINLYIKLRKLKEKHLKVCEADALKQVDANVREGGNKNCSSLYYSNKREARLDSLLDSDNYCLDSSLDIDPKDDLEDKEAITAKDLKNKVVAIDSANSILCDLSDLLVVRFCIFSNSALENIGILTNKEVVEMQTDTTTALADKLAAVNKLIIAEANMPTVHLKATKHCLVLLAAQFALVCGFGKIDRHVFRANNTISGRTVFDEFYNCKLEGTIIAKFY